MGIRTACLILAIFVLHGPFRWVAVAAAVVLPYIAVIFANAGPALTDEHPTTVEPQAQRAIDSAHPALERRGNEERSRE
jgi:hypothetical protein